MSWPKPSLSLTDKLSVRMANAPFTLKKMFGCPVYFYDGKMAFGVFSDGMFLKVTGSTRALLTSNNIPCESFEPMAGRKMKEYVYIRESVLTDELFAMISDIIDPSV